MEHLQPTKAVTTSHNELPDFFSTSELHLRGKSCSIAVIILLLVISLTVILILIFIILVIKVGSGVKQHPWLVGIGLANEQDGSLLCSGSGVLRHEMFKLSYYNIIFDLLHHMSNNHQQRKASSQDPFSHWTPY